MHSFHHVRGSMVLVCWYKGKQTPANTTSRKMHASAPRKRPLTPPISFMTWDIFVISLVCKATLMTSSGLDVITYVLDNKEWENATNIYIHTHTSVVYSVQLLCTWQAPARHPATISPQSGKQPQYPMKQPRMASLTPNRIPFLGETPMIWMPTPL